MFFFTLIYLFFRGNGEEGGRDQTVGMVELYRNAVVVY
jgi:hypothetical protein